MSEKDILEIAKQVSEVLTSNLRPIEFGTGGVPTKIAAKVLGMDEDTVRNCMEMGVLNIGFIHKAPAKRGVRGYRNVYISPKLLYELTGYVWRGAEK